MPELPEVETVRRGLAPVMENARIQSLQLNRRDLRFPFPDDFAQVVKGQTITSLGRRSKYLLVELADDGGLDAGRFATELVDETTEQMLASDIHNARSMGIGGFPSLALLSEQRLDHIGLNYADAEAMLEQIETLTAASQGNTT